MNIVSGENDDADSEDGLEARSNDGKSKSDVGPLEISQQVHGIDAMATIAIVCILFIASASRCSLAFRKEWKL